MEEPVTTPKRKKASEDILEVSNADTAAPKLPREKKLPKKIKEEKESENNWRNDGRIAKIGGLTLILFSFLLAVCRAA